MSQTILRHLESRCAIAERMVALSGRKPNAAQTDFASSCLLHGRLFWDSASAAPLETKPLLLYYGAAAFAKALVVASQGLLPQDLSQSHGLSCKAGDGDRIGNFTVKAQGTGLFQEFNDVAARLNRLKYFVNADPRVHVLPTAPSSQLASLEGTLLDCFSRLPALGSVYSLCTGKEPEMLLLGFSDQAHVGPDWFRIRTDVAGNFEGVQQLRDKVSRARARFPFLGQWCLGEAVNAWGNTILEFDNCSAPPDELERAISRASSWRADHPELRFEPFGTLPPLTGGWADSLVACVAPIGGYHLSEYSIMLAALLGLSSLVRYHPHTWTACVHRRPISGRAIDDSLLPLISEFLVDVEGRFPRFIAEAMTAT